MNKYISTFDFNFFLVMSKSMYKDKKSHLFICQLHTTLLPILRFVLDEKFQQNASKFAIFYIYENPKLLFPFFISCYFIFLPNECPGLC